MPLPCDPATSLLEGLLPRRPRRTHPEPAGIDDGSTLALAGTRFPSRRALLGGLTGPLLAGGDSAHARDPVLALVQRITQGFDLAEYERARAMGYEAYLEEQLDPQSIDDSAMDGRLAGYTSLSMSPKQLFETYGDDFSEPYYHFKGATLLRSVHSRRQLLERMCEFWNDHFSIDQNKSESEWLFLPDNERFVVRPSALGHFRAMLFASAHGAAMLFYLDNWLNVAGAPQENYARELLELHTLGVDGGYSEVDVKEVAKCFTGWTLNLDRSSQNWLRAHFESSQHTGGPKLVLGNTIEAFPPRNDAHLVIEALVEHPSTKRFLARKLIRWFLTPEPAEALVERVAAAYGADGDVKAMLRVILARENVIGAAPPIRPKFRRPFHFVVSLLRGLGAEVSDPFHLVLQLYALGHVPFDHLQPDGYPDTVEAWGGSLLPRWRFASRLLRPAALSGESFPGVRLSYAAISDRLDFSGPADRPGLAKRIDLRLFGGALLGREVEALQEFIDDAPSFDAAALYESIALAASLPGYQWY